MKKRVLAALLAVCMIAATCVLFASAEEVEIKKDSYYQKGDDAEEFTYGDGTLYGDLQSQSQIVAKVSPKSSGAKLAMSLSYNPSNFELEDLEKIASVDTKGAYFHEAYEIRNVEFKDITTTASGKKTATVVVTVGVKSSAQNAYVYKFNSDTIKPDESEAADRSKFSSGTPKYRINSSNKSVDIITVYEVELIEEQQPDPPVLDKTSVSLIYKESEVLKSSEPVVWSSSNDKVAKIDKVDDKTGVLTITGEGVATITATTQDGRTATCVVMAKYAWWQVLIRIFLLGFLWY